MSPHHSQYQSDESIALQNKMDVNYALKDQPSIERIAWQGDGINLFFS